jgi:hypothetical protein
MDMYPYGYKHVFSGKMAISSPQYSQNDSLAVKSPALSVFLQMVCF